MPCRCGKIGESPSIVESLRLHCTGVLDKFSAVRRPSDNQRIHETREHKLHAGCAIVLRSRSVDHPSGLGEVSWLSLRS